MADGSETSQRALIDVIKELRDQPPLLFGIGAGLVLVGILAVTTSFVIVAIVAVIFLAALGTWLVRELRAPVASGGPRTDVSAERAEVDDSANVGGIRTPDAAASAETKVTADDAKVGKGAIVGGIEIGDSRPREGG
jgi:hypothetical protein